MSDDAGQQRGRASTERANVDMKLEVVVIPVSDVDRAKEFYGGLGWRLGRHAAWRPGGPVHAARLGVLDPVRHEPHVGRAGVCPEHVPDRLRHPGCPRRPLERGVEVSEVFHLRPGRPGRRRRVRSMRSYGSFATFSDPDGNSWLVQEITTRLPGRIDAAATTFGSATDLASAMRRASVAHGEHEKRTGAADANWPDWYAAYMVAERAGAELPT